MSRAVCLTRAVSNSLSLYIDSTHENKHILVNFCLVCPVERVASKSIICQVSGTAKFERVRSLTETVELVPWSRYLF